MKHAIPALAIGAYDADDLALMQLALETACLGIHPMGKRPEVRADMAAAIFTRYEAGERGADHLIAAAESAGRRLAVRLP